MLSTDNPTTRARSKRAALEVVRDEGLAELTTRAIARRSGLTQPAIYRHFSSVDDLIRETLGAIREMFFERLEAAVQPGDPRDRLITSLEVFRDFAIEEPRLYDALFLQPTGASQVPVPVDPSRGQNIFGFIVERVGDCAQAGVVRSAGPVSSALSLVALCQGLILLYRQGRFASRERFAEAYGRALDDLLRGLA